jgi:hypothetical protein
MVHFKHIPKLSFVLPFLKLPAWLAAVAFAVDVAEEKLDPGVLE